MENNIKIVIKLIVLGGKMAQGLSWPADEPEGLSWTPGTYVVEKRTESHKQSLDLQSMPCLLPWRNK